MRLRTLASATILCSLLLTPSTARAVTNGEEVRVVISCVDAATTSRLQADVGAGRASKRLGNRRAFRVTAAGSDDALRITRAARARAGVISVELDHRVSASLIPNDPYYAANQWDLRSIGAPAAWDIARGSSAVKVAVVDTGVQYDHPDLQGVSDTVNDYDFVNLDADAYDDDGHGTGCAGTIGALLNNARGGASLAGGVTILPVKVLDSTGSGWDSDVADGVRWAADHGAKIISMSLGGDEYSSYAADAMAYARSKGCILVAAAGNGSANVVQYPAGYPGVLGVGAVDQSLARASFSNWGSHVDLCAPGVSILAPKLANNYALWSGTSFSTPLVASQAALMWSAEPTASRDFIERAITDTVQDLGPTGRDDSFGAGMIKADAALRYATDHTAPTTLSFGIPSQWTSQTVTADLAANDGVGSGVRAIHYTRDGSVPTTYTAPLIFTTEGTSTIAFWSEDRAGNIELPTTRSVRLDRQPPRTIVATESTTGGATRVTLSASDALSGVVGTSYSVDGGVETSGTTLLVPLGDHSVDFYSRDAAGNTETVQTLELTATPPAFVGLEQTDARIAYSGPWATFAKSTMSGGSYAYVNAAASARFSFTGTALRLVTAKSPAFGIAKVTVDGGTPVLVDLYAPAWAYQQTVFESLGLAAGTHDVVVEWTGAANPASTNRYVGIDRIEVDGALVATPPAFVGFEQTDARIAYSGPWATFAKSTMSAGSYVYANAAASARFSFTGTALRLVTAKSPAFGIAKVTVDGGTPALVDLYAPAWAYQQTVFESLGLAAGTHDVVVEWTGAANPASTNRYVGIDRIEVDGTLVATPPAFVGFEQTDARIAYSGPWATFAKSTMSAGSYVYANAAASARFSFTGTALRLVTAKSPAFGIAKVTVDGGTPVLVDLYAPAWAYQQTVFESLGLAAGTHDVVVEWTGAANPASTNRYVGIDRVEVDGTLATP